MKAQMRFQKVLCIVMLVLGALTLLYAFAYCSGSLGNLGTAIDRRGRSFFEAAAGKRDATLYTDVQPFNNMLMYFGIVMILASVLLFITGCNSRRNYYVSNYVAIGICSVVDIVMPVVALIMNAHWQSEFLKVDFDGWQMVAAESETIKYSNSTLWFNIGYAVYVLMIIAAVVLILNLVWKIKLMQGEKKLLEKGAVEGGVA